MQTNIIDMLRNEGCDKYEKKIRYLSSHGAMTLKHNNERKFEYFKKRVAINDILS